MLEYLAASWQFKNTLKNQKPKQDNPNSRGGFGGAEAM